MFAIGKTVNLGELLEDKNLSEITLSTIELLIIAHLRVRELRNESEIGQYGYDMMNDLNSLFGESWEAKSGTIYPLLSKLESNKNILTHERNRSPLGPVKKVYYLTESGRKIIDLVMKESLESDIDFILKYFNLLAPFVLNITDKEEIDRVIEKLMSIPAKGAALAMEKAVTENDKLLKKEKLQYLLDKIEQIKINLENEIKNSE